MVYSVLSFCSLSLVSFFSADEQDEEQKGVSVPDLMIVNSRVCGTVSAFYINMYSTGI